MKTICLNCEKCKKSFEKRLANYKSLLKKNPLTKFFCSKECQWNYQNKKININCDNCNISFYKTQSQFKKSVRHFCSRSCAASFNNKIFPKRSHDNKCTLCGIKTLKPTARYCDTCRKQATIIPISEKTILEMQSPLNKNLFSYVRKHAREKLKNYPQVCAHCGYDKHVETCHIKPISSFPKTTKIKDVNNLNNLILLCPNCHWEFDHKKLII